MDGMDFRKRQEDIGKKRQEDGVKENEVQEPYLSDEEIEALLAEELANRVENDGTDPDVEQASDRRRWIPRVIATLVVIALFANIVAFWPQVYSLAAIQFLAKSRELAQNEDIQRYKEAVVVIRADDRKGTGFSISQDGMIVTNEHVIGDAERIMVHFADGSHVEADLLAADARTDLALLKTAEGDSWPSLPLDLDRKASEGDSVFVIGNPLFFNRIANEGVVLQPFRFAHRERPVLALKAPIYKGNSGSPVIDKEGYVVAVVYATTRMTINGHSERIGLAVPVADLAELFRQANVPF